MTSVKSKLTASVRQAQRGPTNEEAPLVAHSAAESAVTTPSKRAPSNTRLRGAAVAATGQTAVADSASETGVVPESGSALFPQRVWPD